MVFVFCNIFYNFYHQSQFFYSDEAINFIYGAFAGFVVVLVFYVLPLYITAKEREKHSYFEIPMAAQILAIINAANLLL